MKPLFPASLISVSLVCAGLLLMALPSQARDRSMLGIQLGVNVKDALRALEASYGKAVQSGEHGTMSYWMFAVSNGELAPNFVVQTASARDGKNIVTGLQIVGDQPVNDLDLEGHLNLGLSTAALRLAIGPSDKSRDEDDSSYAVYANSGLSIRIVNDKVQSILMTHEGLMRIDSATRTHFISLGAARSVLLFESGVDFEAYEKDPFQAVCPWRHPITNNEVVPLTYAAVVNTTTSGNGLQNQDTMSFMIDTGAAFTHIAEVYCDSHRCTTRANNEKRDPAHSGRFIDGEVALFLGRNAFPFDGLSLRTFVGPGKRPHLGTIGADVLASIDIILNFGHEYLCFPDQALSEIADQIGMHSVSAQYDAGRIWLDFVANGLTIKDYFIDTGSDTTSLLLADIQRLGLKKKGSASMQTASGIRSTDVYAGPVIIEIAGYKVKLDEVIVSHDEGYRKIGHDVLRGFVLGLSRNTGRLYLKKYFEPGRH